MNTPIPDNKTKNEQGYLRLCLANRREQIQRGAFKIRERSIPLRTAIFSGLGSPTSLKVIEHKIVTTIAITRSKNFLPIRKFKNSMRFEVGLVIELDMWALFT